MSYPKGFKVRCISCEDHILTLARELRELEDEFFFSESDIDQTEGQAPWVDGDITYCRKCGTRFFNGYILIHAPDSLSHS